MAGPQISSHQAAIAADLELTSVIGDIAAFLKIAHQIPGRVRFKINPAVLDLPALRGMGESGLTAALGEIPGVHEIRINRLARSCTIEYDHRCIPDAAWQDLLTGKTSAAAKVLLDIIEHKHQEIRHGKS